MTSSAGGGNVASTTPASVPGGNDGPDDGARGGCMHCYSLSFNNDWYKAFGVLICNNCRRDERLISKGSAKQQYLLTDGDFRHLGCIEKENPHNKLWAPLRLYMLSQVEEVAHRKHGGADGLEAAALRSMETKIQQRASKRKEAAKKVSAEAAKVERVKRRLLEMKEYEQQQQEERSKGRARVAVAREEVVEEGAEAGGGNVHHVYRVTYDDGTEAEVEDI